ERQQRLRHRQDQLIPARKRDHDRRTPGSADLDGPDLLAVAPGQGDQQSALVAGVDNEQVLVDDRRRAGAEPIASLADARLPELFALEIEAENAGLAEQDEDVLAVRNRRTRSEAVQGAVAVVFRFRQECSDFACPEDLAADPL